MKKSTTRTAHRKLRLRREQIATLTISELGDVAGADTDAFCSRFAPRSCNPPVLEDVGD